MAGKAFEFLPIGLIRADHSGRRVNHIIIEGCLAIVIVGMIIGFVLLYKGGDFLVTGAAGIARKKNIPAFIIGITLVAFGTSAPELFFNLISALHGNAEFALSNVSGSNLINLCVGIGVSAMITALPIKREVFAKDLLFLFMGPSADSDLHNGFRP